MSDQDRPADRAASESAADAEREAAEAGTETGEARAAAERVREAAEALQAAEGDDRDERVQEFVQAAAAAVREAREAEVEVHEAVTAAQTVGDAAVAAAGEEDLENDPLLDIAIRQIEAGATDDQPFGTPGEPIAERSPFRIAFSATAGVLVALLIAFAVINVRDVIVLIVVSAFLAIGLNPAVELLQRRGLKRGF